MKNTLKFYTIAAMLVILAVSCKKKSGDEDITSLPYAQESVSEGKSNLETTGQQMIGELNTLADVQGVSVSKSMSHYLDLSNPFVVNTQSAVAFASVNTAAEYGTKKDTKGIFSLLNTSVQNPADTSLAQVFKNNKGIYTWNSTLKKWDKTASNDKIELLFPSTETGTTNNAKFDLTYQGITKSSAVSTYTTDLPTSIDAVLYISSEKIMEYSFTAQYDNNGNPTNVSTFYALYPFKFEVTASYNSSSASVRYLFTDADKTIFDLYSAVNGNLSQDAVNNSNNAGDIINNCNAYFQVLNIKLAGNINYKGIFDKMSEIEQGNYADSTANKMEVDAMNQNIALVLMYADTKQKIAQAEFYPTIETDGYYDYYSNDIRFIFTDKSKGSLKSYFGSGFKDVVTDFNTLIVKLNTKYGLGAGTVTYTGN